MKDRDMFYVFPRDDKKEAVAAADVLTPEEELLLLTNQLYKYNRQDI